MDMPALPRTILVATDLSRASNTAASVAASLARSWKAEVWLLHIFPYVIRHHYLAPVQWMVEEIRSSTTGQLETLLSRFTQSGCDAHVLLVNPDGSTADQILSVAGQKGASLIVVGTHSRDNVDRFFVGSTAEQILRRSRQPVIVVGPHVLQSWSRDIEQVIWATDLSETCLAPLCWLPAFLNPGTRIAVVRVVSSESPVEPKDWADPLKARLASICGEEIVSRTEFRRLIHRYPAQAIREEAERSHADLLMIGMHRAGDLAAHAPPGIGMQIIMSAPCAVLAVSSA